MSLSVGLSVASVFCVSTPPVSAPLQWSCCSKKLSPMRLTTNLSPAELSRRYGANILSRIEGAYRILPFFGDDIRKQKK